MLRGKYALDSEIVSGELEIRENHKFKYRYIVGLIDTESEGTWEIKDNQIVLTSDPSYQVNKIEVKEFDTDTNYEINMQFRDGSPVVMANLIINRDSSKIYRTNERGKIELPDNADISSFTVFYLGEVYKYKVQNKKSFMIQLVPDDLSKTYFYKRKFKLKRNRIIDQEYNWKYCK